MKRIILIITILLMSACSAFGGTYTIEWDANAESVDGYRLYTSVDPGGPYGDFVQEVGTVTTLITDNMSPGQHCFVLTAWKGELESSYSNEVCGRMPMRAPFNLRMRIN